jgi:membrane-associated phospholipid phosphatase
MRLRAVAAFGASLFIALAVGVTWVDPVDRIDRNVVNDVHDHATGALVDAARAASFAASARVLIPLVALCALWLLLRRRLRDAVLIAVALAGEHALNVLLKAVVDRPRPQFDDPASTASGLGFPSGHAMAAAAVATAFVLVFGGGRTPRVRIAIIAAAVLYVLAVGASRVVLGVHYPADVLGGWAAGLAWTSLCAAWLVSRGAAGRPLRWRAAGPPRDRPDRAAAVPPGRSS